MLTPRFEIKLVLCSAVISVENQFTGIPLTHISLHTFILSPIENFKFTK